MHETPLESMNQNSREIRNLNFRIFVSTMKSVSRYIERRHCSRARAFRMPLRQIKTAFNVLWTRDRFIDSERNKPISIDRCYSTWNKKKKKTSFEIHSKLASLRSLSSPICSSLSLPFSRSSSRLLYLTSELVRLVAFRSTCHLIYLTVRSVT